MGYTHYWYRPKILDPEKFKMVVRDFKKMVEVLEHLGVPLADWNGKGKPIINDSIIRFNGVRHCGHPKRNLGITWASNNARGVSFNSDIINVRISNRALSSNEIAGSWFGGAMLGTRTCDGDCSHESFNLEQEINPDNLYTVEKEGKYFNCCKTAFKPYDLAVNIVLVIAKHYFGDDIDVHTDGVNENWKDAFELCQHFLGYGNELYIDEEGVMKTKTFIKVK